MQIEILSNGPAPENLKDLFESEEFQSFARNSGVVSAFEISMEKGLEEYGRLFVLFCEAKQTMNILLKNKTNLVNFSYKLVK